MLPDHAIVGADDLLSVAVEGFIAALPRWDPSRGLKVMTFLAPRVHGAIADHLRAIDWVPRLERRRERDGVVTTLRTESIDRRVFTTDAGRGTTVGDAIVIEPDHGADARDAFGGLLIGCDRRERLALTLYYREDLTMREIGAAIGVSESRVSQMFASLLPRLRARLTPIGAAS